MQETIISDLAFPAVILATLLISGGMVHADNRSAVAFTISQSTKIIDPIILAQQHFEQIQSYQVRVHSSSPQGENNVIRYSYLKPGYVRMDFIEPHSGAVLIYSPDSGKVRLWPFGLGMLPVLSLLPTNTLIQDSQGHRIDQSDMGMLLRNIRSLQQGGSTITVGDEILAEQSVLHLSVVGHEGFTVGIIHRYDIWLDYHYGFPTKVVSYNADGRLLETVLMDAMVVNIHFPTDLFTP